MKVGIGVGMGRRRGGAALPAPPAGYVYLLDSDGLYVLDSDGLYILVLAS